MVNRRSGKMFQCFVAVKFLLRLHNIEGREGGGGGGGGPNPISQEIVFFSNSSSNPKIPACVAQIEIPFPFFYFFL